jgi:phage-related tail fiber protein
VGAVFFFAKSTPPEHALACDGAAVSRAAYPELFRAIGTTFGAGDGSTTFNLPDLRGKFVRGTGGNAAALGVAQGDATAPNGIYLEMQRAISLQTGSIVIPTVNGGNNLYPFNANGDATKYEVVHTNERDNLNFNPFFGDIETRPANVALLPCIIFE